MKVLIFSRQSPSPASLQKVFESQGIHVELCASSERALHLCLGERYTAVIDVQNGQAENSLELYAQLKQQGCLGQYIIVTNNQSLAQRAQCLESGVGQYFIAPFSYRSLLTEVILYEHRRQLKERPTVKTLYFELNIYNRTAYYKNQELLLTRLQYDLLALLVRRRGIVLSRVELWEELWGYEEYPLANTIDVHINRLRKRLGEAGQHIKTVYGIGYRMAEEV